VQESIELRSLIADESGKVLFEIFSKLTIKVDHGVKAVRLKINGNKKKMIMIPVDIKSSCPDFMQEFEEHQIFEIRRDKISSDHQKSASREVQIVTMPLYLFFLFDST